MRDDNCLYFIMEFICGGDMHNLSKKNCILRLDEVKFYMAEVILAIGKNCFYMYRGTTQKQYCL